MMAGWVGLPIVPINNQSKQAAAVVLACGVWHPSGPVCLCEQHWLHSQSSIAVVVCGGGWARHQQRLCGIMAQQPQCCCSHRHV